MHDLSEQTEIYDVCHRDFCGWCSLKQGRGMIFIIAESSVWLYARWQDGLREVQGVICLKRWLQSLDKVFGGISNILGEMIHLFQLSLASIYTQRTSIAAVYNYSQKSNFPTFLCVHHCKDGYFIQFEMVISLSPELFWGFFFFNVSYCGGLTMADYQTLTQLLSYSFPSAGDGKE